MNKEQMLEVLSEAVNVSDRNGEIELGDQILEVIEYLKKEWVME